VSGRQKLLDAEEKSWRELAARLGRIPGEDWTRPGVNDDWNAKDLLAHIAVWHAQTTDRFESLRMTGDLPDIPDVDAFNREQYERMRDEPLHEVRAISAACRHRFREEVALLPLEPDDGITRIVVGNGHGHYEEHFPGLDTFLEGR
jgi:hypothetical protein